MSVNYPASLDTYDPTGISDGLIIYAAHIQRLYDICGVIESTIGLGNPTNNFGTISAYIASRQSISEKGQANGYASLDSSGKIPTSQIPDIALSKAYVYADEATMVADSANLQEGDVAIATLEGTNWIRNSLNTGTISDFYQLSVPYASETVNGVIKLATQALTDAGVDDTTAVTPLKLATNLASVLGAYLPLTGGTMSGNINMGGNSLVTSSIQSGNSTLLIDGNGATSNVDIQASIGVNITANTTDVNINSLSGDININGAGSLTATMGYGINLYGSGNIHLSGSGTATVATTGDITLNSSGNVTILGNSDVSISSPNGNTYVSTGSGDLNLTAGSGDININGGAGGIILQGGSGNLTLSAGGGPIEIFGGSQSVVFSTNQGVSIESTKGLLLKEQTAPPAAPNYGTFYVKSSDGLAYFKTSSGVEYQISSDEKVKISSTDTTTDYLTNKVVTGSNKLSKTILNPSGNEQISLDVVEANLTHDNIGGTLSISKGGTGQTTANAAFGALSPMTTDGDLITRSGGVPTRIAAVATGNALISNGTSTAPSWGKIGLTTHVSGTLPIANGGTGQTTNTAAFNALSPLTTNGDIIYHNGTNNVRLGIGSSGQVLTVSGGVPTWANAVTKYQFQFSLPGNAVSTIGLLSKANSSTGNPGGLKPTTSSSAPGINNGGVDPYIAVQDMTINKAYLKVAHAATSTASFSSPATAKFDVYRVDYSTRTLLGTITFNVTNADTNDTLTTDRYSTYTATPSIALSAGDAFGIEFRNEGGSPSKINSLGGIFLVVEAS